MTPCNERLISPVFLSVTFCVLVDFRARLPKLIEVGVITRFAMAASPLPERAIAAGLDAAFVVMVTVAVALPAVVGAKVRVNVTLSEGRIETGTGGPEMVNSLSETAKPDSCRVAVPVFETLNVLDAFWPTTTAWKLNELAERERPGVLISFGL